MIKNYTHSIMFHHFHGSGHPSGQGSISGADFEEMVCWLANNYNLISANSYLEKLESSKLNSDDICLSFDDALLCQSDIAVPILNKLDIQAFFFVYSSPFFGDSDPLEIYRYFRNVMFQNINDFYEEFFNLAESIYGEQISVGKKYFDSRTYLIEFPFYTPNDKWFRFLRDKILGVSKYNYLMNYLMNIHGFDQKTISKKLWMTNKDLKILSEAGHVVGLHSFSHPTMIHLLSEREQEHEYFKNLEHLESILGFSPVAMSHPCGNYNDVTLKILRKMGIKIGFRSNNSVNAIVSNLEVPRDDHSNVLKEIKKIKK